MEILAAPQTLNCGGLCRPKVVDVGVLPGHGLELGSHRGGDEVPEEWHACLKGVASDHEVGRKAWLSFWSGDVGGEYEYVLPCKGQLEPAKNLLLLLLLLTTTTTTTTANTTTPTSTTNYYSY